MRTGLPYRLIASDMDGTLLNSNHRLSLRTKEILRDLILKKGVQLVFATGRHCMAVEQTWKDLRTYLQEAKKGEMDPTQGFFLVTSNGARIHDPRHQLIAEHNLDGDIVEQIYRTYGVKYTTQKASLEKEPDQRGKNEISVSVYTTDMWFMSSHFYPKEELKTKFGMKPFLVPFPTHHESYDELTKDLNEQEKKLYQQKNHLNTESVFDWFPLEGIGKLCLRCHNADLLREVETEILERYGDRVSVAFSSDFTLDVMKGGVSKSSAIQEVLTYLNQKDHTGAPPMTLADVIAFGDSMNDKEMLATVGKGFLMKNAQPRLKEELKDSPSCAVTTLTNDEDGVALTLSTTFSA